MKKILVMIRNENLAFSFIERDDSTARSMLNTNVINNNELLFSLEYILKNIKIVSIFIKELWDEKNLRKVFVNSMEMVPLVTNITSKIEEIEFFGILEDTNFTYGAYESIIKYNNIDEISCYSIPTFMIELFDQKDVVVQSRAEVFFTSNFMQQNNLNQYSKIYYKIALRINLPLSIEDLNDLETFCKVNKYLKTVHFNSADIREIDNVVSVLFQCNKRNIKIIVHDNVANKKIADNLKTMKKKYKKYHIYLKLTYTKDYVKNNYLKQIIITTLAFCAIGILLIVGGSTAYIVFNNKISEDNVLKISQSIKDVIEEDKKKKEEPSIDDGTNTDDLTGNDINDTTDIDTTNDINPDLESVVSLNSDTVGWLTVPGTNIDYPVVKTLDNSYYLNHNFNKENDYNGWVFMNYINNSEELDKNTVLFAHNRYYSGVMFGTLNNVVNANWYEKAGDNLISFNTLYHKMQWEVFSIYKIDVTADYLKTDFSTNYSWMSFIDMIKSRSIFKSETKVDVDDKIITLSTCLDNDKRLVVHAVLKK